MLNPFPHSAYFSYTETSDYLMYIETTKDKDKEDDLDAFQEKMEVGPSFALAKVSLK